MEEMRRMKERESLMKGIYGWVGFNKVGINIKKNKSMRGKSY